MKNSRREREQQLSVLMLLLVYYMFRIRSERCSLFIGVYGVVGYWYKRIIIEIKTTCVRSVKLENYKTAEPDSECG